MTLLNKPRIGFGGMSIEASNFSPHRSGFEAFNFTRNEALIARYDFLQPHLPAYAAELDAAFDTVPLVHARSLPGGMVEPEVYEALKTELIEQIHEHGPFDGFYLDIHGAMTVVGRQDAEADLAQAVREALDEQSRQAGTSRCLVSATMDLHGNVTAELVEACDLLTCYRMAPHEDEQQTKQRALANLVERLENQAGAPHKAFARIPVLLPGEKTSTRLEPAKGLYEQLETIEALAGITDASIWVGYAWADEPRCYATVVVTGDDAQLAKEQAEHLARQYWDAREDFAFVAPAADLATCLDAALAPEAARPYFISDSGDNPTAGGSGDVTWTLTQLLADPRLAGEEAPRVAVASIFDAPAVERCFTAGLGAEIELSAGARIDHVNSGPVALHGTVHALTAGDATSGRIAVIRTGGIHAIITERRKPYHKVSDFHLAGLPIEEFDIVIVKIGYLEPELYDLAEDWTLALTPGGVDQDLLRLGHQHIDRPMYPFDQDMDAPALEAKLYPAR